MQTDVIVTLGNNEQIHVQLESDQPVTVPHVAWRPAPGATWGPPWPERQTEISAEALSYEVRT